MCYCFVVVSSYVMYRKYRGMSAYATRHYVYLAISYLQIFLSLYSYAVYREDNEIELRSAARQEVTHN